MYTRLRQGQGSLYVCIGRVTYPRQTPKTTRKLTEPSGHVKSVSGAAAAYRSIAPRHRNFARYDINISLEMSEIAETTGSTLATERRQKKREQKTTRRASKASRVGLHENEEYIRASHNLRHTTHGTHRSFQHFDPMPPSPGVVHAPKQHIMHYVHEQATPKEG